MVELISITKHFKKNKPHHTVVQFADDGKFWEYTVPAKERFKVFSDERFILIEDYCIPFPEECEDMTYMGLSDSSMIFVSRTWSHKKQMMVTISPTVSQPIIKIRNFRSYRRYMEDSKHPVIKKLLEVNDAKEIHIFNGIREKGTEGAKMFAVQHDDKVFEIKFLVFTNPGGIDRLLQTGERPSPGYNPYISQNAIIEISERESFLLGEINHFEHSDCNKVSIISMPDDTFVRGTLYWQAI